MEAAKKKRCGNAAAGRLVSSNSRAAKAIIQQMYWFSGTAKAIIQQTHLFGGVIKAIIQQTNRLVVRLEQSLHKCASLAVPQVRILPASLYKLRMRPGLHDAPA